MSPLSAPIPILRSFNDAATKTFYVDFLGFEIGFEHRFDPQLPLYMEVRRNDCVLHLSEHHGDGVPGVSLRIEVRDVHAFAADLRGKAYRHSRPGEPQAMEWGSDDLTIADPSGNRLTFYSWRAEADR